MSGLMTPQPCKDENLTGATGNEDTKPVFDASLMDDDPDEPIVSEKYLVKAVFVIGVMFALFQLYTAGFGSLVAMLQRIVHLTFVLVLVFLCYPSKADSTGWRAYDCVLALLSLAAGLFIFIEFENVAMRVGDPIPIDIFLGSVLILLMLIATKRTCGWPLVIVIVSVLVYVFYGHLLDGAFSHRKFSLSRIVNHYYLSMEGIWGITLGVAATYLVTFILFGAFLSKSGGSKIFFELAFAVAGWARGGPAKVAILASALLGMINGSATANVVTTGAFTIPLMKKTGYKPEVAGAIEAVASSGGAIMPPVMGAGAFVMAEMTGIPYATIIISAIIPAVIYYVALWWSIDFEAAKQNMKGLPREVLPDLRSVLKRSLSLFLPLFILIFLICVVKYSPIKSAFWGIVSIIVSNLLFAGKDRMTPMVFLEALVYGAKSTLMASSACGAVGLVVGAITLTGVGTAFTSLLLSMAENSLLIGLVMVMIITIVMGMALPPTAAYVVVAAIAAPAMTQYGLPVLTAHLFIYYYTCFAPITPPVCIASFAGASLAEAHPMRTGLTAARFAIAGFICPFMFIFSPAILLQGDSVVSILWDTLITLVGTLGLAAFAVGWFRDRLTIISRIMCLVGGVLMIQQGFITDAIGVALLLFVLLVPRSLALFKKLPLASVAAVDLS